MNDRYVIMRDEQDTGTGRELYLDQILWEPDCGVLAALAAGEIPAARHQSYLRLYEAAEQYKPWEK